MATVGVGSVPCELYFSVRLISWSSSRHLEPSQKSSSIILDGFPRCIAARWRRRLYSGETRGIEERAPTFLILCVSASSCSRKSEIARKFQSISAFLLAVYHVTVYASCFRFRLAAPYLDAKNSGDFRESTATILLKVICFRSTSSHLSVFFHIFIFCLHTYVAMRFNAS